MTEELKNDIANAIEIRRICLTEAIKLKQSPMTCEQHKDKTVIALAKEIEDYLLGK